jgi:CubicO group peptidase (beta-lactamase class C family)
VAKFLPDYFAAGSTKSQMTLEHLLTMTSGLDWENSEDTGELMIEEPADSIAFTLGQPLAFKPGTKFHYSDANPHIMAAVLQEATGMALEDYAFEKLFSPLGITDYVWEMHRDSINYGAYGLYLRARDLAKIGQLALNEGTWAGKTVVSPGWVTASTQTYVNENDGPYGYYWWIRPDFDAYTAIGHGGQYAYVIPGEELVIVMTANPYTDGIGVNREQFEVLVYWILDAIVK